MQTIWILECDPQISAHLHLLFEHEGYRVESFVEAGACREALRFSIPDLLVVDLDIPQFDGHAYCRGLRDDPRSADLPVITIGQEEGVATRCRTLSAGADDFVAKPFDSLELLLRAGARLRRGQNTSAAAPAPIWIGDVRLDLGTHVATVGNREVALTQAEFSILAYLISRPGRAVSSDILLIEALGYPPKVGNPEIVRAHIRNLRLKIEDDPASPARLVNIPRVGYIVRASQARASA